MGNRTSYEKLPTECKNKVCFVFPCYLAINTTTLQKRCVCRKGKKTDNPDEVVILISRFHFPDEKFGFYFYVKTLNPNETFKLENTLMQMCSQICSCRSRNAHFKLNECGGYERIITKSLYDACVARYKWIFDDEGHQIMRSDTDKDKDKWTFIWSIEQQKELESLTRECVKSENDKKQL